MIKGEMRKKYQKLLCEETEAVTNVQPPNQSRRAKAAKEKGSLTLLSLLPIERLGFGLSKVQFWDAIALGYGWQLRLVSQKCRCEKDFDMNHILTCKVGGFHTVRHNQLRDTIADLLQEVCCNVSVEPLLQPQTGEFFPAMTNAEDDARLDVRARGFWDNRDQDAFFNVRVFYPSAPSYRESSMAANYRKHELEKKQRQYGLRVREVDQGCFTSLIITTGGGAAPEVLVFLERLAEKRGETYSNTMGWIRCMVGFCSLQAGLTCIRSGWSAVVDKTMIDQNISEAMAKGQ